MFMLVLYWLALISFVLRGKHERKMHAMLHNKGSLSGGTTQLCTTTLGSNIQTTSGIASYGFFQQRVGSCVWCSKSVELLLLRQYKQLKFVSDIPSLSETVWKQQHIRCCSEICHRVLHVNATNTAPTLFVDHLHQVPVLSYNLVT